METVLKCQEAVAEGALKTCSFTYREELVKLANMILGDR
jgi:hypothetical protein